MFLDMVVRSQAQRLARVPINTTVIELCFPSSLLQMPTGCENPAELWPLGYKLFLGFAQFLAPQPGAPASAIGRAFQEGKQEAHPIRRLTR